MPVLKVYDVSTSEKIEQIENDAELKRKNNTQGSYTVDDIVLVRATDYLDSNGVMKPYSESPNIVKGRQNFLCNQLSDKSEIESFETYYPCYRSTIHTTENGLVSSHMYGNFDKRKFIILDPLRNQIDKANIRNFAGQDTIIKGSMKISDGSVIIIESSRYQELINENPWLNDYNICLYTGLQEDEKKKCIENDSLMTLMREESSVVDRTLMDMGYTPEIIGTHYIIDSYTSGNIVNLNRQLAEERGVEANAKHQYTQDYQDDMEKANIITSKCDRILLDFIIKFNGLGIQKEDFINELGEVKQDAAYNLTSLIGISELQKTVTSFNDTIKQMEESKTLPTPEEFINRNDLDLYEEYNLHNSSQK